MDNQDIPRRKLSKIKDCFVSVENEALHQNKASSSSGKNFGHSHDQNYLLDTPNNYSFYSLVESMPVPEPIWSTTEPSVWASNSFSYNSYKELLDFKFLFDELVDEDQNQASSSSYTWWLGFLKSLDGKNANNSCDECFYKYPKDSCVVEIISGCESCDKSVLGTTDEWLSFPCTPEDEVETTMFIVP